MSERKQAEEFERAWQAVADQGEGRPAGEASPEVQLALDMARQVARLDYSAESQLRESLRRRLQAEYAAMPPESPGRVNWRGGLAAVGGLAGVVVLMACFLLGFSFIVRAFLPGGSPAIQAPPEVAGLSATESPAAPAFTVPATQPATQAALSASPSSPAGLPPVLGIESSPETVRHQMQNPAWESIRLQGQILAPGTDGQATMVQVEAWLDRQGRGRVLTTEALRVESLDTAFDASLEPSRAWVSDGRVLQSYERESGQTETASLEAGWSARLYELAAPLLDLLSPAGLPSSADELQVLANTDWAGRPAVLVSWEGTRYWVDAQTGQILRLLRTDNDGEILQEIAIDSVQFDAPLTEEALSAESLPAASFQAGESAATAEPDQPEGRPLPTERPLAPPLTYVVQPGDTCRKIAELTGVDLAALLQLNNLSPDCSELAVGQVLLLPPPGESPTPTPTPASASPLFITLADDSSSTSPGEPDQGELYFSLRTTSARRLAKLPLSCLLSQGRCEARLVQGGPPPGDQVLHWSPDGERAVLIDLDRQRLWLYDARAETWTQVARNLAFRTDIAAWSPDGSGIAFTWQPGNSPEGLVAVLASEAGPEGAQVETFARDLGGVQVPLGWQDADHLIFLRSATPPKGSSAPQVVPGLYRLDVQAGEVTQLPLQGNPAWLKDMPALSPDGKRLAISGEGGELGVYELESGGLRDLGVSGSRPVWSTDGRRLAFLASRTSESGTVVEVRVIGADGRGQKKVFEWGALPQVVWAPDGRHLLVATGPLGDEPPGNQAAFYLVSREGGRPRLLVPEGEAEEFEFINPSVRP